MKHVIPADVPTKIDLATLLGGRGFRTITWENKGATTLKLLPGIVPPEPGESLPDTTPPQGYTAPTNWDQRAMEWMEWNGYTLPPGGTLSRAASEEFPITPVWTVLSPASDGLVHSITER
jgi:hypothetical protein